jgi:molybdate-binding protein/DNA-binding transcriptional regulator YhcF (GntR family)
MGSAMGGGESFVYLEIAEAMRRRIVSGELPAGERLPSVRAMSERWRCTPNTVSRAYALLASEGLISGHRGGGTRVVWQAGRRGEQASPEWHWANLVNRAESYLLEALDQGHSPAHAEAALAAAIARWQELRRRPVKSSRPPSSASTGAADVRFAGSHDLSVELLARFLSEGSPSVVLSVNFVGSLGGLMALALGEADIAGSHLWDEETGAYNVPFVRRVLPNRPTVLLNLAHRIQGLIVPPGNPQALTSIANLANPGVVFVNRQPGSGTRVWLDTRLKAVGLSSDRVVGYEHEESTHMGVARAVSERLATVGLGIAPAAASYGLGFIPLGKERYDLVIPFDNYESPTIARLRSMVGSSVFQEAVEALGGYDISETGTEVILP